MNRLFLFALTLLLGCETTVAPSIDASAAPDASNEVDAASDDVDAATDPVDAAQAPELGYLEDVHPIFEAAGCSTFACHGGTASGAGLVVYMRTAQIAYEDMIDRPSELGAGVVVRPGFADQSRLVSHAEETHIPMGILTREQVDLIRRWVDDGAAYSRTGSTDPGAPPTSPEPATCDLSGERGWSSLPGACLPRCAAATWDAVVACRTDADPATCQDEAMDADTTPAITAVGGTDSFEIDCSTCVNWQTRGCIDDACPIELIAFDRCALRGGDPCTEESTALRACQSAHPAITTCQRSRDPLCVGSD